MQISDPLGKILDLHLCLHIHTHRTHQLLAERHWQPVRINKYLPHSKAITPGHHFNCPPTKLQEGNVFTHVCLFTREGPHVTITHDTLDLTLKGTLLSPGPSPLDITDGTSAPRTSYIEPQPWSHLPPPVVITGDHFKFVHLRIPPPLVLISGGQSMYGWQAGGRQPAGIPSCHNSIISHPLISLREVGAEDLKVI